MRFDSAAESRRYGELKLMEKAGAICDLKIHPIFELQPKFTYRGKTIRAINYEADFQYWEGNAQVIEDVKGGKATQTEAFKLKAKMFMKICGNIEFRIVEM